MLQYILNTTAIWLISIVMFDVFLRRESYHSYNRLYLVFTLLLGIFLPLYQWEGDSPVFHRIQPPQQVVSTKGSIVELATTASYKMGPVQYLTYIYLAGAAISLLLLLAEIIKLVRLYHKGQRLQAGSCIIIETGKDHGPFSIFNYIFVRSRQDYSAHEWNALVAHEQLHGMLFHFADVLLLQVAQIVFWFHPLVYVYRKRIMLLHEYQADKVSGAEPQFYGRFLVAQSMLASAPSISHSFNRSPIKNRIYMLTRKSTSVAKIKMFVLLPLVCICTICCTRNSFAQKFVKNGNIITYRGNKIELTKPLYDTMILLDPVTGKQLTKIVTRDPRPDKLNGQKLYNDGDYYELKQKLGDPANMMAGLDGSGLREYLLTNLSDEFKDLQDTQYTIDINNVVINDKGKIVYYENGGISVYAPEHIAVDGTKQYKPDEKTKKRIINKINDLLDNAPIHRPAYWAGEPVPYLLSSGLFLNPFTIKGHVLTAE